MIANPTRMGCLSLILVWIIGSSARGETDRNASKVFPAIRAAAEKPDLVEVLRLYDSHPDLAKPAGGGATLEAVDAAFDVALAAVVLNDPDFPGILAWAEGLADQGIRSDNPELSAKCMVVHNDLLLELQRLGRFEEAYSVAERAAKRRMSLRNGGAMGREATRFISGIQEFHEMIPLLRGIGDFEALEEKFTEVIEMQDSRNRAATGSPTGLDGIGAATSMLPHLAELKARMGKDGESRALLQQYEQRRIREQANLRQGQIPDIPALRNVLNMRDAGSQMMIASTWLELGEPAKALEILDDAIANHNESIQSLRMMIRNRPRASPDGTDLFEFLQKEYLTAYHKLKAQCHLALDQGAEAGKAVLDAMALRGAVPPQDWLGQAESAELKAQLAWARWMNGERDSAKALARELARDHVALVDDLLRFAGERQRLAFLQRMDPFSLLATTGQEEDLIPTVLRLKGVVLDSVLEERRMLANIGDGEGRSLLVELLDHRYRLGSAALTGAEETKRIREETERLERRVASLASTRLTARDALNVNESGIRQALSPADAVVEFVRYRQLTEKGRWEPHYGAVLLKADRPGLWVPLGAANAPDLIITRLNAHFNGEQAITIEEEFKADLQRLYDLLLAPLKPHIGDARRLLLGPDGNLSRISFAALLDPDGRFACETWEMAYVSSLRDILRETRGRTVPDSAMLIVAAPDFSAAGDATEAAERPRGEPAFDPDELPRLGPLPGAMLEMRTLRDKAEALGLGVSSYSGGEATEDLLRTLDRVPGIIHFATHGLVLPASRTTRTTARERGPEAVQMAINLPPLDAVNGATGPRFTTPPVTNHPLERAVLALSGANTTFGRWREGQVPPPASDGVLTAAEIATLDLSATWLAVLSACQTASGEAVPGEGVLGMRRGFYLAGVEHLMMTFWPIADGETVQLMESFYEKVGTGIHPAQAWHQVQRDALVSWREERGLMHAVFLAGPFAITTSGRPFANRGVEEPRGEGESGER